MTISTLRVGHAATHALSHSLVSCLCEPSTLEQVRTGGHICSQIDTNIDATPKPTLRSAAIGIRCVASDPVRTQHEFEPVAESQKPNQSADKSILQ